MNTDDFEKHLARQPLRPLPPTWREEILDAAVPRPVSPAARSGPKVVSWWRSLFWPSPLAWGGVAAAWAVILALNIAETKLAAPQMARMNPDPLPHVRLTLTLLRQVEAELEQAEPPAEAGPPRPAPVLRPRSERPAIPELLVA